MRRNNTECPCCIKLQRYEGFQKLIDLKNYGIFVFQHSEDKQTVPQVGEVGYAASKETFILHSTKNKDISSTNLLSQLDKNEISCPRCRQIFEQAQKLLNEAPVIARMNVKAVCEHCRLKAPIQEPCNKCDAVIKKFLTTYIAEKQDYKKYIKIWLDKIEPLLNKTQQKLTTPKYLNRLESEIDINKFKKEELSKSLCNFKAELMFGSKTALSDTDLVTKKIPIQQKYKSHELGKDVQISKSLTKISDMSEDIGIEKELKVEQKESQAAKIQEVAKNNSAIKTPTEKGAKGPPIVENTKTETKLVEMKEERSKHTLGKEKKSMTDLGLQAFKTGDKTQINGKITENKQVITKSMREKKDTTVNKKEPEVKGNNLEDLNIDLQKMKETAEKKGKNDVQKRTLREDITHTEPRKPVQTSDKADQPKEIKENKQEELKKSQQAQIKLHEMKETADKKGKKDIKEIQQKTLQEDIAHIEPRKPTQTTNKADQPKDQTHNKQKTDNFGEELTKNKQETQVPTDAIMFQKMMQEHEQNKQDKSNKKKEAEIEVQKLKETAAKNIDRSKKKTNKADESKDIEMKLSQVKLRKSSIDSDLTDIVKIRKNDANRGITNNPLDLHGKFPVHTMSGVPGSKKIVEKFERAIQCKPMEVIIGEQITKYKSMSNFSQVEKHNITSAFHTEYIETLTPPKSVENIKQQAKDLTNADTSHEKKHTESDKIKEVKDKVVPESNKGVIRYALSDRTFIDKGWTMLPTEKVVRKMNVYRMRPAHPEFDWFEHNKNKRLMLYDTGEKLADFDDKGRGRWYYRNGRIALDYYDAEETNAQQRFVIYSSGEPDERGRSHPVTILGTFDYLGNGIVFDHSGKIRLKYNQTEGIILDRSIGPVSQWKWHTLNDPPVLQQVMIDTQMAHKDPAILKMGGPKDKKTRPDNEEMLAIEFENFIKEKSKKLSQKFKPFQIKMKALKINEHFSLRVLDQATIYLIFRDGSTNLKLNIGMILDHQEIVDTDTAEVGEVSNNLERFPARTDSLAGLQRSVAYAQRYERMRTERERRLRPSEPCASADQLIAAASRPLRPPLRTLPTGSTSSFSTECKKRRPNILYYNTRLI